MTAMAPTFFKHEDEPCYPGFERVARVAGSVAAESISLDFDESPLTQHLVDDFGGEYGQPNFWNGGDA